MKAAVHDRYGSFDVRRVSEWTDAMVYPVLHRLERRALVKSYWLRYVPTLAPFDDDSH